MTDEKKKKRKEKPISLSSVDFKELMGAFVQVKPKDKTKRKEWDKDE